MDLLTPETDDRQWAALRRHIGLGVAIVGWLVIAFLTLGETHTMGDTPALCLTCGPGWLADLLANMLLFVPLGAGLALAGVSLKRVAILIAITTLSVESLQWRWIAGRDASLADLLANFAGGLAGGTLVAYGPAVLFPRSRIAISLALVWSACVSVGTLTTAWALSPSLPASLWWNHWNAIDSSPASPPDGLPFVQGVRLAGFATDAGPVHEWPQLRPLLLNGGVIDARVVLAADRREPEAEIMVVDDADTESVLISLARFDDGVTFYFRTRAAALRLRSPSVYSGSILRSGMDDTLQLAGSLAHGLLQLDVTGSAGSSSHVLAITPNLGWRFLVPRAFTEPVTRLLTMLWIGGLLLPIGWLASRGAREGRPLLVLLAVFAVAIPFVSMLGGSLAFGLPLPHWTEWLAGFLATICGGLLEWSVSTRWRRTIL